MANEQRIIRVLIFCRVFCIEVEDCDDVRMIERCLLAIVVLNGIGAVLLLAGSIIGCMATCCANTTVSMDKILTSSPTEKSLIHAGGTTVSRPFN